MKKSLLALAALSAFAGAASAQSSVTLFGIVDAGYAHLSAGGRSVSGITNSGLNSSRLGFRGVEDMGGGLRAGFWLEGQLFNDCGEGSSCGAAGSPTGFNFLRRATVSLIGGFGEVRLGRDYTPIFWNTTIYDPFGTNGVGQSMAPGTLGAIYGAGTAGTGAALPNNAAAVRSNNSIGYFLPGGLGGFFGQVMIGFGENQSNSATKNVNDHFSARFGYAAGPVSVAFAAGKTDGASGASSVKYQNIGGSFNAGVITPMVFWGTEKQGTGTKVTSMLVGATVPISSHQARFAYSRYNVTGGTNLAGGVHGNLSANDWTKLAAGYIHNLSKRTALYGTYARVSNKGNQNRVVANNGLAVGTASPGGSANGYELGIRHIF